MVEYSLRHPTIFQDQKRVNRPKFVVSVTAVTQHPHVTPQFWRMIQTTACIQGHTNVYVLPGTLPNQAKNREVSKTWHCHHL